MRKLTALRTLDLEGCDGITSASLACIGSLVGLTHLNLGQCFGLTGHQLGHLSGERARGQGGCSTPLPLRCLTHT